MHRLQRPDQCTLECSNNLRLPVLASNNTFTQPEPDVQAPIPRKSHAHEPTATALSTAAALSTSYTQLVLSIDARGYVL
jgi:hypothetical protein